MTRKLGDRPAFPIFTENEPYMAPGMTLRQWYAGMIRASMGTWTPDHINGETVERCHVSEMKARAEWAFAEADAMISESEKS
jgi:hypothetical protein